MGMLLGNGEFGLVFDGTYNDPGTHHSYPVAIKQVREDAPEETNLHFIAEATLMVGSTLNVTWGLFLADHASACVHVPCCSCNLPFLCHALEVHVPSVC